MPPDIFLKKIFTSNTKSSISKSQTVTATFLVKEKYIATNNFDKEHIQIRVNNTVISPTFEYFKLIESTSDTLTYQVAISNITGNGGLAFIFPAGTIIDISGLTNDYISICPSITVVN